MQKQPRMQLKKRKRERKKNGKKRSLLMIKTIKPLMREVPTKSANKSRMIF